MENQKTPEKKAVEHTGGKTKVEKTGSKKTPVKRGIENTAEKKQKRRKKFITKPIVALIAIAVVLVLFNQIQVNSISAMLSSGLGSGSKKGVSLGNKDLSDINLDELKSTGHTIAAVFPVEDIVTADDALAMLFPTGTPDYGEELGVSYDTPIESLAVLSKMYRGLKSEVETNNPEGFQRYLNMALKPVGISCEYCCGLQAIGIRQNGDSSCGCQHNPALLTVALYLSAYSDYSDGEILREVMRWKTLFFPKNMIELGTSLAGGDISALDNLPGMVGGC